MSPEPVGILLTDSTNNLYVRMRPDWCGVVPDDEIEIWCEVAEDLKEKGRELGAVQVLDWLENTASHVLQIGVRHEVHFLDIEATLRSLFRQYVAIAAEKDGGQHESCDVSDPIDGCKDRSTVPTQRQRPRLYGHRVHAAVAAAFGRNGNSHNEARKYTDAPDLTSRGDNE
jgi:hypothetical protein